MLTLDVLGAFDVVTSCSTASSGDPEQDINPYWESDFQPSWNAAAEVRDVPDVVHSTVGRSAGWNHGSPAFQREAPGPEDRETWSLPQPRPHGDSQGYSTVGETPTPTSWMSLPPRSLPSEPEEDATISPYASYTSMTEKAPPIICSWLDKLSPQG